MHYELRYSSIELMLEIVDEIKNGKAVEDKLNSLLTHPDYEFEFSRYGERVTKGSFSQYLTDVMKLENKDIHNPDLKAHHAYYVDLFNQTDFYREKFKELREILEGKAYQEIFNEQFELAFKGLPTNFKFNKLDFVFTIGIGQSFGYAHEEGVHFDFLRLVKENDLKKFFSIIGHEVHHVAMLKVLNDMDLWNLPLEQFFYLFFTFEGLAVKYCNNAKGIISKPIYNNEVNSGLDRYTWEYLNQDFEKTILMFKKTVSDIRNGCYQNRDELMNHILDYWYNRYTDEQSKEEIPKLAHSRIYTLGNDIWGVIHDVHGKDVVFETISNPKKFVDVYNESVSSIGRSDLRITKRG